jgi:hypothetical protein
MPRILILTTEPLPLPGLPATGAGMRAWGLAEGLRAAGLDCALWFPANAALGYAGAAPDRAGWPEWVGTFERADLPRAVAAADPGTIILQHWGLARELGEVAAPLAIDLAGPHWLERRLWGSPDPEGDLREKLDALRRADFVTTSGVYQRHWFLPFLALAGWAVESPAVAPVIPFSWTAAPAPAPPRPDRFFYGGFLLPWQDPTAAIETALDALEAAGKGELVFAGGPHPTLDVSRGRFEGLIDRLQAHPRARMIAPMPFDQYRALLAEGGVVLDLMARNAERELAFTTRTVTCLAAGLPVIHDDYSELGGLIREAGAGWTLDPDDRAGLRRLLDRILSGEEPVEGRGALARRLASERLDPLRTVGPLARWCADPRPREGKMGARLAFEEAPLRLARAEGALEETRRELATLRGKRWIRWGLGLTSARGWMRWPAALLAAPVALALLPVFLINDLLARLGGDARPPSSS